MANCLADMKTSQDNTSASLEKSPSGGTGKKKGLARRIFYKLVDLAREKDPPHRLALGMCLGIFVGILPIMGIQMAVVTLIALPLRGNLKAAIAGVWISNPITFLPMYWGYYRFGLLFTPNRQTSWHEFTHMVTKAAQWDWTDMVHSTMQIIALGEDILVPMWIGASILATVCAIPTYFFTYRFVIQYRVRQDRKRQRKLEHQASHSG